MAIPEQTITGVSGLGATLLEFCGGQRRNSIPDQLRFSATADVTPVRWLPPIAWMAHFPTAAWLRGEWLCDAYGHGIARGLRDWNRTSPAGRWFVRKTAAHRQRVKA
jgi:hypothetical protein